MACQSEKFSERKSRAEQDWDSPHSIAGVGYLRPAVNEFFVRTLRPAGS